MPRERRDGGGIRFALARGCLYMDFKMRGVNFSDRFVFRTGFYFGEDFHGGKISYTFTISHVCMALRKSFFKAINVSVSPSFFVMSAPFPYSTTFTFSSTSKMAM